MQTAHCYACGYLPIVGADWAAGPLVHRYETLTNVVDKCVFVKSWHEGVTIGRAIGVRLTDNIVYQTQGLGISVGDRFLNWALTKRRARPSQVSRSVWVPKDALGVWSTWQLTWSAFQRSTCFGLWVVAMSNCTWHLHATAGGSAKYDIVRLDAVTEVQYVSTASALERASASLP